MKIILFLPSFYMYTEIFISNLYTEIFIRDKPQKLTTFLLCIHKKVYLGYIIHEA